MFENLIQPEPGDHNMPDYDEACRQFSWDALNAEFTWHTTGKVNIAFEAIDRHAQDPRMANHPCLLYAHGTRREKISFEQMRRLSNRFGNVLRRLGVARGDRVFLFLPRIPEFYIAMVGCAKVGAIIAPLYSDYREGAVRERMLDGQGTVVVTNARLRASVPAEELPDLEHIIIVDECADAVEDGELQWDTELAAAPDELEPEWVDREDPLLLIYTSGESGRPVGLLHAHDVMRGYLITSRWVLDLKPGDVLWSQASPGWLMNVVYSAFAPWLCGVTSFVTGKVSCADEVYRHIAEQGVTVLYTLPLIYRMLIDAGEELAGQHCIKSLRHMFSVLEPLYPDVVYAMKRLIGKPILDTWWTAECGMITLANFPCLPIKPGYLGKPVPGITAAVVDDNAEEAPPFQMGRLALKAGWPSMARDIWNNHPLYARYLQQEPWFMSGDTAFVDQDGYFYYQGRADNALITPAGRVGIGEIEHMLEQHPAIAEAGIVRVAESGARKRIKAFIVLKSAYKPTELIRRKITRYVNNNLSPETAPSDIEFCDSLPRSGSGSILRRVLKAWELGLPVGDIAKLG